MLLRNMSFTYGLFYLGGDGRRERAAGCWCERAGGRDSRHSPAIRVLPGRAGDR